MDAVARKKSASPQRLARELAAVLPQLRAWLLDDESAASSVLRSLLCDSDASSLFPRGREEQADAAAQLLVCGTMHHLDGAAANRLPLGAEHAQVPAVEALLRVVSDFDVGRVLAEIRREHYANDPLGQFHELLLAAVDKQQRRRRGVYYTPAPIVDWMVRAVESLTETHFATAANVRFVDPACGSGAFLRGVVERLQRSTPAAWSGASLVGIDVLPASCAVARCLLALAGAVDSRFGGGSRGGLYSVAIECVNPLLAGDALEPIVLGDRGELPVILGNPPYANFGRMNRGAWIDELLDEYRADLGERKLNLTDDFIKFFRWGQHWIDRAGRGVLALVTSRTYLDGLTHRGMRASLCRSFDEVYVLDLGGDVDAQRSRTAREADENVFGIRRGVAIGVFVKSGAGGAPRVRYHAIQGSRAEKMASLDESDLNALAWQTLAPDPPAHDFVPRAKHSSEYRSWPRIVDVFPEYISGVQTKNDALLTDFCRETLAGRIRQLLAGRGDGLVFREALLRPYLVAPLDVRWIYYEPRLVGRPRWSVMRHMLRPNRALVFMRQSTCEGEYDHFLATDALASDRVFYSTHGAPFLAPLWLYEEASEATAADSPSRRPNLDRAFADELARRLNLRYVDADGMQRDRDSTAIRPEDIFHYAYGVFFDADYRRRFADELRVDFPRLPPVEDPARFRRLRDSGRRLAKLHVAGTASAAAIPATIPAEVWRIDARYPRFADEVADPRKPPHALVVEAGARGGVWLNRELLLAGIAGETWEFRLGGYDALPRWLRQRRGRALDDDQRRTLLRLIATIRRTRSATKTSRRG